MQVLRYRLAQGGDASRVGVAVLAVPKRLDGGLDDVRRRFEIRLADAEIDDVTPLSLQLGRPRQHGERVLLADALERGIDCDHGRGAPSAKRPFWQSRAERASETRTARLRSGRLLPGREPRPASLAVARQEDAAPGLRVRVLRNQSFGMRFSVPSRPRPMLWRFVF